MSELALTRGELAELRGGLGPEPNGDGDTRTSIDRAGPASRSSTLASDGNRRLCAECGGLLPAGSNGRRRYCDSACQHRAKDARARLREARADGIIAGRGHPSRAGLSDDEPSSLQLVEPPAGMSLVELVAALVRAGLAVSLQRDGWEIAARLADRGAARR